MDDQRDGRVDRQGVVSCGAATPPLCFRFLENFANPNFEHRCCRVIGSLTPVVADKRVGHLLA